MTKAMDLYPLQKTWAKISAVKMKKSFLTPRKPGQLTPLIQPQSRHPKNGIGNRQSG